MIPLTQLLQPVTQTQARALFVTSLMTLGIPANQWRQGGVASTILTVIAATYASFSSIITSALQSMFLPYASGAWLVLLAYYVYGVTAIPATPASGLVTFTNTGGGSYGPYAPGAFTILNPTTGITYTNTASLTIAPLATVPNVAIQATTPGTVGSSPPGAITMLVTTALGVLVSNPQSVVGQDAQSDASVRTTCINKLAARSNRGPRNAYVYAVQVAINPVTGVPVNINRIATPPSSGGGIVNVYLASPSGTPTADDLAAATSSILANARPSATTINVFGVTTVPYTAAITIWVQSTPGVTAAQVEAAAESALDAFIAAYPIGGLANADAGTQGLYWSGVSAAASAGAGALAPVFAISYDGSPDPTSSADLPLVLGQVATNETTVNVRQVASS